MSSNDKKKSRPRKKSVSLRRSVRTEEETGAMKLQKVNYLGINHDDVTKKMEGSPKFVNYFSLKDFNGPIAVYHSENPNRAKNHKDYMLLYERYNPGTDKFDLYVSGVDKKDIRDEDRYRAALFCDACEELVYSAYRHDCRSCGCGKAFIDGGTDYIRSSGGDGKSYLIDMLTDKITERSKDQSLT